MPEITPLNKLLAHDFTDLHFEKDSEFRWEPAKRTIFFDPDDDFFPIRLLHETAHGILGHHAYKNDIELLALERDAWIYARGVLAPKYRIAITGEDIERDMDSYRDWMHARSTCPHCGSTGFQTSDQSYKCMNCGTRWRVNAAKTCALRRYEIK